MVLLAMQSVEVVTLEMLSTKDSAMLRRLSSLSQNLEREPIVPLHLAFDDDKSRTLLGRIL